ncbi:efflux RND transporter permease subunit [Ideonella margarita]|uniref:Efflux RND transporter permease subunit n=1 Tax=Ideonella margarita TaxID=2984191 RepID=A0ABU9C6G4_9BURK
MNVSAWSIRNPIPAVMLFVLLTLAGLMSYNSMKVQQFPDLELPTVSVTASLPGSSPSQMETEVARKLENSLATLQGVKHITTKVQDGSVTITVEFRLEKPTQEAVDDVRDAVNRVRSDLPADLRDPQISKLNLSGAPILTYTVASPRMDDEALSWFVDNDITKALLNINGVGSVARVGGVTREVRVELDPARLLALGATASDVSRQLRAVQQEAGGGRTDFGGAEQTVRTIATVQSAEQLAQLDVPLSDGRRIRLSQVATVSDTVAERRSAALLNGKPVVGFEITRSRGAGELDVNAGVLRVLDQLRAAHPDVEFSQAFNTVDQVADDYEGSLTLLYEGAILAVIVVFFFLRDWRATLVAATALPLSVVPAFIGMAWLGFSVNTVTLLSLSLVVGILVDDAIVEIENIVRHLRMGKTPYQAAMEAADEIGLAVIATTFTLIAVFLPTAFMSGIPGKFFKQFGWTAALAVFASLVVARVLTPMMAAYLLKPISGGEPPDGWVMTRYMRAVRWCASHRRTTVLAAAVFFAGSIALVPLLPTGFLPADDYGQSQVSIELPPGSTFRDTLQTAEQARALVQQNPHVKQVYTAVGGGASGSDPFAGGGASEVRKATLTLTLTPRAERPGLRKQAIEADLRTRMQQLPGARVKVGLGGSGEAYVLVLSGDDGVALAEAAKAVERDLRTIPGLGNIASTASLVRPELVVRPDAARAADAGATTAAMADTLRIATSGDYDSSLPKLNLAQRQVPIVVKLNEAARQDPALIGQLTVPGKQGPVALSTVAKLGLESGPAQIDRYDRQRNINFDIELNNQPLGDVAAAVQKLPSLQQLPAGVRQATLGDAEVMEELFASFGLAMLTGVLCIYIVLVLLFKGFMQPATILAALPLSLGGAFVALLLTKSAFSMPSLIGLIMLMGIATKNSILLVDYAIIARAGGMSRWDAVMDACHKRARPIVMTTIAMGAGMMPIALGLGSDPSFRQPMAVAVIGGLITSTFLSLLVIPVIFTYVDDLVQFSARQWRRWVPTSRSTS